MERLGNWPWVTQEEVDGQESDLGHLVPEPVLLTSHTPDSGRGTSPWGVVPGASLEAT